jgi:predicted acylesterase/phospholipase RssA
MEATTAKGNHQQAHVCEVQREEWKLIKETRRINGRPATRDQRSGWSRRLVGLALSGGGIRAASFHLGVLQAFAEKGLLCWIDYLSAVSGGAFIASWFCKLIHTRTAVKNFTANPLKQVEQLLTPRVGQESSAIHRLRQHLTYLTPKSGPLSQSTWLLGATYVHNLFIGLCILTLTMTVMMIAPRAAFGLLYRIISDNNSKSLIGMLTELAGAAAFACLFVLMYYLIRHRMSALKAESKKRLPVFAFVASAVVVSFFGAELAAHQLFQNVLLVTFSAFLGALLLCFAWKVFRTSERAQRGILAMLSLAAFFVLIAGLYYRGSLEVCPPCGTQVTRARSPFDLTIGLYVALVESATKFGGFDVNSIWPGIIVQSASFGLLGFACLLLSTRWLKKAFSGLEGHWTLDLMKFGAATMLIVLFNKFVAISIAEKIVGGMCVFHTRPSWVFPYIMTYIAPACACLIVFGFNFLIALLGRVLSPYIRNEMTDISTIVYRYAFIWMSALATALYGPMLLYSVSAKILLTMSFVWIGSIVLGFLLPHQYHGKNNLPNLLMRSASYSVPYLFLGGYLLIVSFCVSRYLFGVEWGLDEESYWRDVVLTLHPASILLAAILCVFLFLLSVRFGVNSPSMHLFYQSRLADAYLGETLPGGEVLEHGASEAERRRRLKWDGWLARSPLMLATLSPLQDKPYSGPYLLLNASVNLQSSEEPAWQDRRAANFIFSPLYCGYAPSRIGRNRKLPSGSYCSTEKYTYGSEHGVRVAQAVAISGSAISSGMGYHTSPRIRFLHTLFNLRLGWWFANPRDTLSWSGKVPKSRVALLMSELLGTTNDRGPHIHLSDGGHFENTGIYELVRRQCRLIIASDASEDQENAGRSLGVVVERCRTDMGVEIERQKCNELYPTSPCPYHTVTLFTIHYEKGRKGTLIYLHPGMTGSEPEDVSSYQRLHRRFPHESTANQWFKESQFESYRRLGLHVGRQATIRVQTHLTAMV